MIICLLPDQTESGRAELPLSGANPMIRENEWQWLCQTPAAEIAPMVATAQRNFTLTHGAFSVCHKNMHPLIDLSAPTKPGSPICCESIHKIHFDWEQNLLLGSVKVLAFTALKDFTTAAKRKESYAEQCYHQWFRSELSRSTTWPICIPTLSCFAMIQSTKFSRAVLRTIRREDLSEHSADRTLIRR
jgi:hypothetical protein